ncbi:MAG: hypothetical protein WCE48_12915 [Steroidobacteraceae bacterium]
MSPLWRDEIGIYLSAHKLALTRLARGVRPRSAGEASWSNELVDDASWARPLAALDALLAKSEWRGAVARVVISDQWVRYAMVPFAAALSGAAERMAHARHVLTGIYGEVVSQWSVTLSDNRPGTAQVACALPAGLVEELQNILLRHRIPLKSLQPQLVSAYNHWRDSLPDGGAWFVSIECGSLAAARLARGGWDRVHSVRIGADWAIELRRLQTFGRLANTQAEEGRVYVDAPAALRIAAGAGDPDLIWLDEESSGESTAGKLEFLRRHQA